LECVARQKGTAVVVRAPVDVEVVRDLAGVVKRTGIVLLGLAAGASWTQLSYLLSTSLGVRAYLRADHELAKPAGDLFALANAVGDLLDAPITIEDRNWQVLAFSDRQDEADQARLETIAGRKNPGYITRAYQAKGVFKELTTSTRPVYLAPVSGQMLPRVAVAIRAGNEVFGSIWAAVEGPLTPEREQAFIDCGKLVALHMLRQSVATDMSRRFKAQRLMTLLEGDAGAGDAARTLGLLQPAIVWAWGLQSANDAASIEQAEAQRQRALEALTFQVSTLHPSAAITTLGDVAYAVIPVSERLSDAERESVRAAQNFLDRISRQFGGKVGVSRVAHDYSQLPMCRRDADRALRVLQEGGRNGEAGGITALDIEALMLELRDLAIEKGHQPSVVVNRLLQYDRDKNAELTETMSRWLQSFGDVRAAAKAMQVHPNTFRYRLRRAIEVGQIDETDRSGLFSLMMELRLLDRRPHRADAGLPSRP
jgi:DNA-binding PucR family transcriptional regulator